MVGARRFLFTALACFAALGLPACEDAASGPDLAVPDLLNPGATIPCTTAMDCPTNLPMCHPDSHVCVGCISSFLTCGDGLTCDDKTHTCVPADPNAPCKKNADCPRPGFDPKTAVTCEVDAGMCVDCATNVDCVSITGGIGVCLSDHTCQADGGT